MAIIGLAGRKVRLVPPDRAAHLENALEWLNDPTVTACLKWNFGVTRRQEEQFFERIEVQRDEEMLWAILDESSRHIGFCGLHLNHWKFRSARGGIFIGARDAWGHGYASDAVAVRTRFAFEQMGLHRIEGHTINPAMVRIYEKNGYRHEGVLRQVYWRAGRWHDASLYAILDADYFGSGSPAS